MTYSLHRPAMALLLVAALGGCTQVDQALRRVDVLDRVFDPGRFRTPPNPAPETVAAAADATGADATPLAAGGPEATLAETPVPVPSEVSGTRLMPGWYVPDAPAVPEAPEAPMAQAQPEPPAVPLDPAVRTASLLRQNPWLSRFWSQLTPPEQGRVSRALARRGATGEPAATWDPMGLRDRVELVYGRDRATS